MADDSGGGGLLGRLPEYAAAIAGIESGGESDPYSAVGPLTKSGDRAYGKYQVMGNNVGPWTEQYFGQRLTPEQFVANPNAQDAVFNGRFGSYVTKYGNPQDAASAWFTGRPLAQGGASSDVLGTTGNAYVDKFNANLAKNIPTMGGAPSPATPVAAGAAVPPSSPAAPAPSAVQSASWTPPLMATQGDQSSGSGTAANDFWRMAMAQPQDMQPAQPLNLIPVLGSSIRLPTRGRSVARR